MGSPRRFDWGEAAKLYAECGNYAEVGRVFGVTGPAVRFAVNPAARREQRARHAEWQRRKRPHEGVCPDCGGVSSQGRWRKGSRCQACAAARAATTARPDTLRCHRCRLWLADEEFAPKLSASPPRRGRDQECRACQRIRKRDARLAMTPAEREAYLVRERERKRRAARRSA